MKKTELKQFVKEIIEKNPFKVGDLVKLRPDALNNAGSNIQWKNTLKNLLGKTGKVTRVFEKSKHINVKYPVSWKSKDEYGKEYTVDTIGIDYTMIIPSQSSEMDEGVGWGMPKDIAKDPKHTVNKTTGKNQRWTVKFDSARDLKKHGYKGKSKVNEKISINELKTITKAVLKEMWVGWEEQKDVDEARRVKFRKVYGGKQKENPLENDNFTQWQYKNEDQLKQIYNAFLRRTGQEDIDIGFQEFSYLIYQQHQAGLNESTEEFGEKSYIIWAKSGPVTVYYVNSPTQGERMVQNAQSMATKFPTEEKVRHKIIQLKQKYPGIKKFDFEIVRTNPGMDVWKPHGPKEFQLGHQVFKPVKKNDEYIVRWVYNGKTLPHYSYYTDDKKDALDTYELMYRSAKEMNRKNEPPHEAED